jgi:hypothetical protein
VESGTMSLELNSMPFTDMRQHLDRVFRHVAEGKSLHFAIEVDPNTPEDIYTDGKRLEQILRNLLSNAFKFTDKGYVSLRVAPANSGWSADHPILSKAESVVAFTVSDTGIGIPRDKQKIIFEAFQQAESGTSRKYGGTGLGLSISRELAKLLGGQVILASSVQGKGSTFVLYLPTAYKQAGPETKVEKKEEAAPFLINMPYRIANRFNPDAMAQERPFHAPYPHPDHLGQRGPLTGHARGGRGLLLQARHQGRHGPIAGGPQGLLLPPGEEPAAPQRRQRDPGRTTDPVGRGRCGGHSRQEFRGGPGLPQEEPVRLHGDGPGQGKRGHLQDAQER